jgi:two-component system sensor histidine kinase KdpD
MTLEGSRPATDEVLARVKAEAGQKKRGRLTVFLGYAPGVGKTFAMLEAARERRNEVDVVVGLVETHGRQETEALLEGLEIIPRRKVEYRGIILHEMDLDAVLIRRPQLALVDELAHTNASDSRHSKRYQDVEELLAAGIDVYTTLNIQHVESLRNTVAQITHIWIRETVPDSIIDIASEIELVDLPPDELLERLKEGKVYLPEQIALAVADYFKKGNLIALRELAMRIAAERVDEQAQSYKENHAIPGTWRTAEQLLVCISPSTSGSYVIRSARRLASQLSVHWHAVYVDTPDSLHLSTLKREHLMNNIQLATRLGAQTLSIQGISVAETILDYARQHHITKILVAKPSSKRLSRLFVQSTADQLIKKGQNIDIIVIGSNTDSERTEKEISIKRFRGYAYLPGIGLSILVTILGYLLGESIALNNIAMLYLLSVVITAIFWGLGPSILASIISVLVFDFFLVPPRLTFAVNDAQHIITFISLLSVGTVVSLLTTRVRAQSEAAQRREHEMSTLYILARSLAKTAKQEEVIPIVLDSAREIFGQDTVLFLPGSGDDGTLTSYTASGFSIEENDTAAAQWSFKNNKVAGAGTDTLSGARARYLPLNTASKTLGILALFVSKESKDFMPGQKSLLEAFSDLVAVAIERAQLAQEAQNALVLEASGKLQTALLNSISHDLRTPLVSIIGVLSSLTERGITLDDESKYKLLEVARGEAERLNHLITNLLDITRLESGVVKLSRQPVELQDIINTTLELLGNRTDGHPIDVNLPDNLPFVFVDNDLIVHVFFNILDNAIKYSAPGLPIEIEARQLDSEIEVSVADYGAGIPAQDLKRVFDKFYRVERPESVSGTGLGLSIAKGIVEAHGGRIFAENRRQKGTEIHLTLPIAENSDKAAEA